MAGRAGNLRHLLRLRRADALKLDAGALLNEGHEALLAPVDERHADARAARAARAPAAVDVCLGVLGRLALQRAARSAAWVGPQHVLTTHTTLNLQRTFLFDFGTIPCRPSFLATNTASPTCASHSVRNTAAGA